MVFILFFAPVVALTVLIPFIQNQLLTPISYLSTLSLIRAHYCQLLTIGHHAVMEDISKMPGLTLHDEGPPLAFGNSSKTLDQMEHVTQLFTNDVDSLSTIITFRPGDS